MSVRSTPHTTPGHPASSAARRCGPARPLPPFAYGQPAHGLVPSGSATGPAHANASSVAACRPRSGPVDLSVSAWAQATTTGRGPRPSRAGPGSEARDRGPATGPSTATRPAQRRSGAGGGEGGGGGRGGGGPVVPPRPTERMTSWNLEQKREGRTISVGDVALDGPRRGATRHPVADHRAGGDGVRVEEPVPRPEREHLRATFTQAAELYDRARPGDPQTAFADLAELAGLGPGGRVLIGCGTGQATRPLLRHGFEVTAVELGAQMAATARERLDGVGVAHSMWRGLAPATLPLRHGPLGAGLPPGGSRRPAPPGGGRPATRGPPGPAGDPPRRRGRRGLLRGCPGVPRTAHALAPRPACAWRLRRSSPHARARARRPGISPPRPPGAIRGRPDTRPRPTRRCSARIRGTGRWSRASGRRCSGASRPGSMRAAGVRSARPTRPTSWSRAAGPPDGVAARRRSEKRAGRGRARAAAPPYRPGPLRARTPRAWGR